MMPFINLDVEIIKVYASYSDGNCIDKLVPSLI